MRIFVQKLTKIKNYVIIKRKTCGQDRKYELRIEKSLRISLLSELIFRYSRVEIPFYYRSNAQSKKFVEFWL